MPADTTPSTDQPAPPLTDRAADNRPQDKVRLRFRKLGPLRLLSHHDLMRTFERLLRRAEIPFHRTQGFHPKPRVVFALSLPLGVIGRDEVVEIELTCPVQPYEMLERLSRHAPPGLEITSACRVPLRQTAQVRGLSYALPIEPERVPDLQPRLAAVLEAPTCVVERTRPPRRRLDLRPFLRDLRLQDETGPDGQPRTLLVMDLWLTDRGTARPEEVLRILDLDHLLDAGAVLERLRLELEDEHTETKDEV
jgi:radical SAM-linked protein